jgi:hypothetical protein
LASASFYYSSIPAAAAADDDDDDDNDVNVTQTAYSVQYMYVHFKTVTAR